uniref:hypothetical protein n=1 Tax=Candidatus Vondammii sp. HM_W22 TaxID=2687299 RepID=UPI002E7C2296|nr:hypothetical protein [Candidatus Vondammii sp. HM_W22]
MNTTGYGNIPRELFHWITLLCKALPLGSAGTFIGLLIGSMPVSAGFITDAYLMLGMRSHWTSYYKWLQNGRWSWLTLARSFVRLILRIARTMQLATH